MMEEGIGPIPEHLRTKIVNVLFERGSTEHWCRRVSYVIQNDKLHHHDKVITTWATYLSRTRSLITRKGPNHQQRQLEDTTSGRDENNE